MTLKGSFRIYCNGTSSFTPVYANYKRNYSHSNGLGENYMKEYSPVFNLTYTKQKSRTDVFCKKDNLIDECIKKQVKKAKRQNIMNFGKPRNVQSFLQLKNKLSTSSQCKLNQKFIKRSITRLERSRLNLTTVNVTNTFNEIKRNEFTRVQTPSSVTHMLKLQGVIANPPTVKSEDLKVSGISIKPFKAKLMINISKEDFQHISELVNKIQMYSTHKPTLQPHKTESKNEKTNRRPVIFITNKHKQHKTNKVNKRPRSYACYRNFLKLRTTKKYSFKHLNIH